MKNPGWHSEDASFKAHYVTKMIEKNNLNPRTICDVGCGSGDILVNLHNNLSDEAEFCGYEISPQAYEICKKKERHRLNFYNEDILQKSNKIYDLLLMIDVFEHIPDYIGFLKDIRSRSRNTIFHIPLDMNVLSIIRNSPKIYWGMLGHIHFFTKDTALNALEDCGFKIVDFFYTPGAVELPPSSLKNKLFKIPRKAMFAINQDIAASILGGFSLMVLTK